jgi:hypothetical protein
MTQLIIAFIIKTENKTITPKSNIGLIAILVVLLSVVGTVLILLLPAMLRQTHLIYQQF